MAGAIYLADTSVYVLQAGMGRCAGGSEVHGATVLHYDADHDRIQRVTGQPTEWIAVQGSL